MLERFKMPILEKTNKHNFEWQFKFQKKLNNEDTSTEAF